MAFLEILDIGMSVRLCIVHKGPTWFIKEEEIRELMWIILGPCKGGVQGFWTQISNGPKRIQDSNFKMARFWIQISNWTRFRIQNFSYFWDSNFKPLF